MNQDDPRARVLVVIGTRPEAIKLAPVILALRESSVAVPVLCATAQHRKLLDDALGQFGLTADLDLDLMLPSQSPDELLTRAVPGLARTIRETSPALVVGQGDTTTTLAAALAAFYADVPFAHVEAGLRTGRFDAPYPEEMNRVLTARLARLHFAPNQRAHRHLLDEGVDERHILVTGNTIVDALHSVLDTPASEALPAGLKSIDRIVVVTAHRRENHGPGLLGICTAVRQIVENHPASQFAISVHPNPAVSTLIHRQLAGVAGVHLLEPPPYREFIRLLAASSLVLTDSGGIQEEAASLGIPVVVLRDHTERPELLESGLGILAGTDPARICAAAEGLLAMKPGDWETAPFGDGRAAERIVRACEEFLST